jgi:uridine kinase
MGHSESEAAPDVTRSLSRLDELVAAVAAAVPAARGEDCVRVGIDGVDGAGKTTFAAKLGRALQERGRPVVRISVDDFHRRRADRYRRGRDSPVGFWLDAFDYARLHADVLVPLGPGGTAGSERRRTTLPATGCCSRRLSWPSPVPSCWWTGCSCTETSWCGIGTSRSSSTCRSTYLLPASRPGRYDCRPVLAERPTLRSAQEIYLAECSPRGRASMLIDNS